MRVNGPGYWASVAARIRSTGPKRLALDNYRTASQLEDFTGECRTWGPQGQTQYLVFGTCTAEFENDCRDEHMAELYMIGN